MNLSKARKRFSRISNLIPGEGADAVVGGRIYVAAVLAVMLYGLEFWVWTNSMLNTIRGFHHRCCRQLADKRPKRLQNGTYVYCPADEAMKACKLRPIQVYIARRRHNIKTYVVKRPIYKLCKEATRSPGTPTRTQFWWDQDLDHWLELGEDGSPEGRLIHDVGV